MRITAILNTEVDTRLRRRSSQVLRRAASHEESSEFTPEASVLQRKVKTKLAKDAAKFMKGPTKGEVRYPAYDITDEHIIHRLAKFNIDPELKSIGDFPRRIPYTSDKKALLRSTGRDGFEVFQYTFRFKGSDKPEKDWVVMWDYNIGLVRITPFFKCMSGNKKTDPKNAILASPGLLDLCHSITGGALAAQGYWLPYEAARALAATFCHSIRYPLALLFGPEFITDCILPSDPIFRRWTIPASVVARSAEQSYGWSKGVYDINRFGNFVVVNRSEMIAGPSNTITAVVRPKQMLKLNRSLYKPTVCEDNVLPDSDALEGSSAVSSISSDVSDDDSDYQRQGTTPPTTANSAESRATSFEPSGWTVANPSHAFGNASSKQRRGATPSLCVLHTILREDHDDEAPTDGVVSIRGKKRAGIDNGTDDLDHIVDGAGIDPDAKRRKPNKYFSDEILAAQALMRISKGLPGDGIGW